MNQRQNKLFETLKSISVDLSDMYKGAILVLNHKDNPQRFVQASHSLRELLDKFPEKTVNVKISTKLSVGGRLIDYVINYVKPELLEGAENDSEWISKDEVIEIFKKLLFYTKEYNNAKSRKDEFVLSINKLDTFGAVIPEFFNKEIEEKYIDIRSFFIDVCHQEKEKNKNENDMANFHDYLLQFDRLLLSILTPKPTEDIIKIGVIDKKWLLK